ncbi:hypothetical protein COCOBI_08-3660 [Coccomyxa sp. Obi]|nr:hypothetical protein COCOBI_08-3660 [Coccomyxa sp. Obi]
MALRQQISRFADLVRANKELIFVTGAVGLAIFGLGATFSLMRADNRNLELQLQKEIELRQKDVEKKRELREKDVEKEREVTRKGEEDLKAVLEAAKAEAAKETMERILQWVIHRDNRKLKLKREGQ